MDVEVRIKELEAQLNEQVMRKQNLRLALRQAGVIIERLQGALAFAREMQVNGKGEQPCEPSSD